MKLLRGSKLIEYGHELHLFFFFFFFSKFLCLGPRLIKFAIYDNFSFCYKFQNKLELGLISSRMFPKVNLVFNYVIFSIGQYLFHTTLFHIILHIT